MDTNINEIQSRYSADTIKYDDSNLSSIIEKLTSASTLIKETIPNDIKTMSTRESLWKGKSKNQYLGLKDFLEQYQEDFSNSIDDLKKAAEGLETLFGDIPSANVLKEIDSI